MLGVPFNGYLFAVSVSGVAGEDDIKDGPGRIVSV